MPIVEVPGMGDVEFPDDMNDDQIAAAIKKNLAPQKSSGLGLGRGAGLVGRAVAQGIGSLPLLPLDAGVAVGNLINRAMGNSELPYFTQRFDRALTDAGLPEPQGAIEKGGSLAISAATGAKLPMPVPQIKGAAPAGFAGQQQNPVRLATLKAAQKEGYVAPPSTTNPTATNKFLESIGGKIAMEQDASLRNMKVTDSLMKRDLGLNDAAQMSEDVLPALRAHAAGPYKQLRSIGTMRADADYGKALDKITSQYRGAAKDFPGLARNDILDAVEAVRKPAFEADSAMDAIAIMRDKAATAYGQGDKALGKAYREISGAMEGAIERSLARRGKDSATLLKQFREARQLIAKSYTAEGALNPTVGSFNAQKLATQLAKGKPLSGDMKKVAEFAQAFPKAAKLIVDSGSVRNTDVMFGAGTAALSKEPTYLLYPFLRQAVRAGLLSKTGQQLATPGSMQLPPELLYGSVPVAQGLFQ